MQRRITKKLSKAIKTTTDGGNEESVEDSDNVDNRRTRGRRSSSKKKSGERPRRQQNEDQNQDLPNDEDNDDSSNRKGQPSRRSSKENRVEDDNDGEFRNSRLGAFLPGNNEVKSRLGPVARFDPVGTGSQGFVVYDEEEQRDEEEMEVSNAGERVPNNSRIDNIVTSDLPYDDDIVDIQDDNDSLIDDDEDFEPKIETKGRSRRKSSSTGLSKLPSNNNNKLAKEYSRESLNGDRSSNKTLKNPMTSKTDFGENRKSKTNMQSSSRDRILDRRNSNSLKGISSNSQDIVLSSPSYTNTNNPLGLSRSSIRLPPYTAYNLGGTSSSGDDVMALPIEIPDNVSDEDAFRRYLSVRRGAYVDSRPVYDYDESNPLPQASYESVGGGGYSRMPAQMALIQQATYAKIEGSKKTMTLSYAIMTLALLSASATQLRFLFAYSKAHAYSILNYFLISICILIEVVVGLGYVVLSRFNIAEPRVETIHSYLISGLFIVALFNVIIAAFAFDDHVCEVLAKNTEMFDTVDQSK